MARLLLAAPLMVALVACATLYRPLDSESAPVPVGMVELDVDGFDQAWVRSGDDFAGYTAVLIEPAVIGFDPAWGRSGQRTGSRLAVTAVDIEGTRVEMQAVIDRAVREAIKQDGRFQIVSEASSGVLRLRPKVRDLYITAIDPMKIAARVDQYVRSVGHGTAALDIIDSSSNQTLMSVSDWRETRSYEPPRLASPSLTASDFTDWYQRFSKDALDALP